MFKLFKNKKFSKKEKNENIIDANQYLLNYLFPRSYSDYSNNEKNNMNYPTIIHFYRSFTDHIKDFYSNNSNKETLDLISNNSKFFYEFYDLFKILIEFIDDSQKIIKIKKSQTSCVVNVNIWGSSFAKKFIDYFLSSTSFQDSKFKNQICFIIFIDDEAETYLKKNKIFIKFKKDIKINLIKIPKKIFQSKFYKTYIHHTRYYLYGSFQSICWNTCSNFDLDLSILNPDNIYSNSFFDNNYSKIEGNNKPNVIFGSNTLRIQEESLKFDKINNQYQSLKKNKFDSSYLLKFALENIHHSYADYILGDKRTFKTYSDIIVLPLKNGLNISSFWAHPYFISKNYIKKFKTYKSFLPLDNQFPHDNNFENFSFLKSLEDGFTVDIAVKDQSSQILNKFDENEYFERLIRRIDDGVFNNLNYFFFKNSCNLSNDNIKIIKSYNNEDNISSKKMMNHIYSKKMNDKINKLSKKINNENSI